MPPKASVIVVAHNSARWIANCLTALEAQAGVEPFEIIVIDHESVDGTPRIVAARFPNVRLVNAPNKGFGAGCNLGARNARSPILAFLNPDTVPEPEWLRELIRPLDEEGIIATSALLLASDPARLNTLGQQLHLSGLGFVNGLRMPVHDAPPGQFEVAGVSGAAFAVRLEDWNRLGGFDESFFLYVEDTELAWRAHSQGVRIIAVPGSRAQHQYEFRWDARKIEHLQAGRIRVLRRYLRAWEAAALLPSLLLMGMTMLLVALARGGPGLRAWGRGLRRGWAGRPERTPLPFSTHASWRIPWSRLSTNPLVRILGALLNLVFRINAFWWPWRSTGELR